MFYKSHKNNSETNKKKYLEDIVILRLVLIFLLIWNHAFAPYSGKWNAIPNIEQIQTYKWLVLVVYHMRIQALIFISGYLLGYTSLRKNNALSFKNCVIKKIKRLLIPSIIFSILYYMIFYSINRPISYIAYTIVNGAGHLWFLPMLFWCFVGVYIMERFHIRPIYVLTIALIAAMIPLPGLPLRIDQCFKYFIYFYIGFGLKRNYFKFLFPSKKIKPIILCIIIYFTILILNYIIISQQTYAISTLTNSSLIHRIIAALINNLVSLIMSVSGLLAAFWSTHYFIIGKYKLPEWMINLSTFCYGIYICHQFILKYLYYNTKFPDLMGSILLPWVAIILTLLLSIIITYILLHTKIGRYLIG